MVQTSSPAVTKIRWAGGSGAIPDTAPKPSGDFDLSVRIEARGGKLSLGQESREKLLAPSASTGSSLGYADSDLVLGDLERLQREVDAKNHADCGGSEMESSLGLDAMLTPRQVEMEVEPGEHLAFETVCVGHPVMGVLNPSNPHCDLEETTRLDQKKSLRSKSRTLDWVQSSPVDVTDALRTEADLLLSQVREG